MKRVITINGKEHNIAPKSDLYGANLRGANLAEADLRGADLRGADLREADLADANLYGADLRGASLYKTNLIGVFGLTNPEMTEWAELCGAILSPIDSEGH